MNSNRGVTTTSLIIYIIAMLIVVGIISTITSFFYTNINNLENQTEEITKFNMYFLQDIKMEDNTVIKLTETSITFSSGNTFTFQDNSIYLNNSKICENVKNLLFNIEEVNNKKVINVLITVGENVEYTKTTKYVLSK